MNSGISIVIPTYNGGNIFQQCLEKIAQQHYPNEIQIIVIDSGSTDGTPELALKAGACLERVEKSTFHHARTRNKALDLVRFDTVVYMVQDAIPCASNWLLDLTQTLVDYDVSAAYIRQVPHDNADLFARYESDNYKRYLGQYPKLQQLYSLKQFQTMPYNEALRTIRMDNVCAIYRREALQKIPFPDIPFAEDMGWAYKTLLAGGKILYEPRIKVKHSHNRAPEYRLKRSVVESVNCAKIIKRLNYDLSFISVEDMQSFSEKVICRVQSTKNLIIGENYLSKYKSNPTARLFYKIRNHHIFNSRKLKIVKNELLKNRKIKTIVMEKMAQTACNRILQNTFFVTIQLFPEDQEIKKKAPSPAREGRDEGIKKLFFFY